MGEPLDPATLKHAPGKGTSLYSAEPFWSHQPSRPGPDPHTQWPWAPEGGLSAFPEGEVADLLIEPPLTDRPAAPGQHAGYAHTGLRRTSVPFDPAAPDCPADEAPELRGTAEDTEGARHGAVVAARGCPAAAFSRPPGAYVSDDARSTGQERMPGTAPADVGNPERTVPGHIGFVLDEGPTERLADDLPRLLALTREQVLTGVLTLALARWQDTGEVRFDVRDGPGPTGRGPHGRAGRIGDSQPVHVSPDSALDALDQLKALAGPLASCAAPATGRATFAAFREGSPGPLPHRSRCGPPPARARLTLPGPGEPLPSSGGPVGAGAHGRLAPDVEVRAHVVDGRLRVSLDWVPRPAEGITDTSVGVLADVLRGLLRELADVPPTPVPRVFPATPQQSALYTSGSAGPGTGLQIEQLLWTWYGSLSFARFTAAWQSVFDRETVLRTAFAGDLEPLLVVHDRAVPEVVRHSCPGDGWSPVFLEHDRLRGFDLRRPGPLRLTLLEPQRSGGADVAPPTRILLTYHRALLDRWSAHILLREFYRAYLAGGTLPGGERRPDLRDYTAWVASQDPEPARRLWARPVTPGSTATRPGRPAGATGLTGTGRTRLRLDPAESARLTHWASAWGAAESSVLQAVWAMLIHRASGTTGSVAVRFAVTATGRGLPLEGAERMPGPLRNPLPLSVEVDPAAAVPHLLRQLRDRALDMTAYEWVSGDWIGAWDWSGAGTGRVDTVVVFEDPPPPVAGMETELAALGVRAEFPATEPAHFGLPFALLAHHDSEGGLVLTGVHDLELIDTDAANGLLAQTALLLRQLPALAGEFTTVGEVLELLHGSTVPRMAEVPRARPGASR